MAKDCKKNTSAADSAAENVRASAVNYIESRLTGFMGNEAQLIASMGNKPNADLALAEWKKAKERLVNLLVENMEIVGRQFYDPQDYIDLLSDYLQSHFKIFGGKEMFLNAAPSRVLAASKLISKLVNLHRTRYGKKLNFFERAFFPLQFFAQRIDRFGFINKYIREVSNLVENSKRSGTRYKTLLNKIYSAYLQSAQNLLGQLDHVPEEYVMDGVEVRTRDHNTVLYLGSRKKADGQIEHKVYDEITEERKWVEGNTISRAAIVRALSEKYTFEFSNDVMAGQARDIVWRDKVDENHKVQLKLLLDKLSFKIGKAANNKFHQLDLFQGINNIYETEFNGVKYRYVIFKDAINTHDQSDRLIASVPRLGEGGRETYSAYLISHQKKGESVVLYHKKGTASERFNVEQLQRQRNSPFRNGWYKAKEQKVFGRRVGRSGKTGKLFLSKDGSNEKGYNFDNLQGLYMNNQPHTGMLFDIISRPRDTVGGRVGERQRVFNTFWKTIGELRQTFDSIGKEIHLEATRENQRMQRFVDRELPKILNKSSKLLKKKEKDEFFEGLNTMFDLNNKFYITKRGEVITPNAGFNRILDNYIPYIYEDATLRQMIDDAIEDLEEKVSQETSKKKSESLEAKLIDLRISRARLNDDVATAKSLEAQHKTPSTQLVNKQVLADRSVFVKHREEWTDITKRKKDSEIVDKYIDTLYYNLNKNKLMLSLLETLSSAMKSDIPAQQQKDLMHWMVNRTKITLNDPTAWAGVGRVDWSYKKMAEMLNKWVPGARNWDEFSARNLVNYSKGTLSAMLLGHSGAIINRTQILNAAVAYGWDMVWRTGRILRDGDETFSLNRANAIISHVGTDEVANMLMDSLVHGGDLTRADAGLISTPFMRLPIPTKTWFDFMKMIRTNRQSYIENGIPEIDLMLQRIDFNRIKSLRKRIDSKENEILSTLTGWDKQKVKSTLRVLSREYERVTSPSERRTIQELRENFLDLIMTPKEHSSKKQLRIKYKKILGDVSENRMKRIVGWKLSWWWEGFGKELFTFTESERFMRKQTVLMALLNAQEAGLLGKIDPKKQTRVSYIDKDGIVKEELVPDIFLTDEAVRIARNAVADTMFGMSQPNLGEAWGGFGAQLGLYKAYPWQQMLHDWKILEAYMAGNVTKMQAVQRILDAALVLLRKYKERILTGKPFEYDPNDSDLDHEAIAMLRFLTTRVAMSVVSIFAEVFGIFRSIFRTPLALQFNSMIRGGENPVLGLLLRIGTNALIMLTLDPDDDEESSMIGISWDIMRLLLPVFFTLPLHLITSWTSG